MVISDQVSNITDCIELKALKQVFSFLVTRLINSYGITFLSPFISNRFYFRTNYTQTIFSLILYSTKLLNGCRNMSISPSVTSTDEDCSGIQNY